MRKTIVQLLGGITGFVLIVLVINLALSARPVTGEPAAPAVPLGPVEALEARFKELGIPYSEIRLVERSPLKVDFILQGTSDTNQSNDDDLWAMYLATREADLAYLNIGEGIDQYRLVVNNAQGKAAIDTTAFLYPWMFSQQLVPAGPAAIGDEETYDLILKEWNVGKNEWLSLQVESDHYARENTKYVYMEWTTGTDSLEESRSRVQALGGIPRQVKDFNTRYGAQIAIVRVRVFDPQGNPLAQYIYDDDIKLQMPRLPEGVAAEWMPGVASEPQFTETPVPTPTSWPIQPTLTPAPYP